MRGIKLKRSLLCFVMVFSIVFSLCGCKEEEISIDDMPEIVFVVYQLYNDDYIDGEYAGKKYEGYYITRTGEIMFFEFNEDEVALHKQLDEETYERLENDKFTMTDLVEYNNLEEFHKKITQYAVPSKYDRISNEDMQMYYKMLLKANINCKTKRDSRPEDIYFGYTGCYGVRFNDNADMQFIPLYELGSNCFAIKDRNCQKLHENLKKLLPDNKLVFFEWRNFK